MRFAGLPHNPPLTRAIVSGLLGRLPLVMMMLSLVLLVRGLGHPYWVVGITTGCLVCGTALAAPFLGRLADRVGAVPVLAVSTLGAGSGLLVIAAIPERLGPVGLAVLAFLVGASEPPVNAVLRASIPRLAGDDGLQGVYAVEAALQEVLFVVGPPLVALIVLVSSPRVALATCGVVLIVSVAWFTVVVRPHVAPGRPRTGPSVLSSRGLRLLVGTFGLIGIMFGAIDISTVASLDVHGHRDLAGLALGVWAVGSLVTGVLVARRLRVPAWRRLPWLLGLMSALTAPLILLQAEPALLFGGLLLQGCCIAASLGTVFELVPSVATEEGLTEAFAWTSSFILAGFAVGAAVSGTLTELGGAGAGFALATAAPLAATLLARAVSSEARPAVAVA